MSRKPTEADLLTQALSPLSTLAAGVFANQITAFLTRVAAVGGATAIAGLSGPAGALVFAVAGLFGITEAWKSADEKKKAGRLADDFAKLKGRQDFALQLINDIADGKTGVTLDWFTEEELKDRIVAGLASAGLATSAQVKALSLEVSEGREEDRIYHDTADRMLREILSRLDQRGEDPLRTEADTFEQDYLKAVIASLDEMELFGIDPRIDLAKRKQQLSIAYLALNLTDERGRDQAPTPFSELLAGMEPGVQSKVLIRGDAGSGKSTLLKWTAIKSAEHMMDKDEDPDPARHTRGSRRRWRGKMLFDESGEMVLADPAPADAEAFRGLVELLAWTRRIPFFIPLRKCSGGEFPRCPDFPSLINESLRKPPDNWVESVLEAGRGLLMIDGLDEVPPKWRKRIDKAVDDLLKLYGGKGNLFIATSRPLVVDPGWIERHGFREARIAPMSETDRNELIDLWHKAVGKQLRELHRGEEADALPEKATRLKTDLAANPMVAQVATNPLMCAMLCALCGQMDYKLPDSQYEIIEQLCKVLLHSREEHTPDFNLEHFPAAYRRLKYPQRKAILARLGYDMVLGGFSSVQRQALLAKVQVGLAALTNLDDGDDLLVVDALLERSGLLHLFTGGEIDFIHNRFKEFLASDRFIAEGHSAELGKRCLEAAINNVCLFAAAAERAESFVDDLLRRVLPPERKGGKAKPVDPEVHQRRLLAIRMREVAVGPDAELARRIDSLRAGMFPPRTMADAEALASLGDAVVQELRLRPRLGVRNKARCVRALRLISTPLAGQRLREYADAAGEKDAALLGEMVQAMNPLDVPEIARRVTSKPPAGMNTKDKTWLPEGYRGQILDLKPLARRADHKDILRLDLVSTKITDAGLEHIAALTALQSLILDNCAQITDAGLEHIAALTRLQSLSLDHCTQITDAGLRQVANLTGLQYLSLIRCKQITKSGWQYLSALTGLRSLSLGGTKIDDAALKHLGPLTGLQSLYVGGTEITGSGLQHLSALTVLQTLKLAGEKITDAGLEHLAALTDLQSVILTNCKQITDGGLGQLAALPGLHSVDLYGCRQITDAGLEHLTALTGLQSLNLTETQITDAGLAQVAALTGLQSLDLVLCIQVTDAGLEHLAALTGLQSLNLNYTHITNAGLEHLAGCTELKHLDTIGTSVTEAGRKRLFAAIHRGKRASR
ncbi:MAG: hypothetical protein O7D91_01750 [Planctomycetota bacterium]|nr:hypothetical protein [Planctomycetota bacterium]